MDEEWRCRSVVLENYELQFLVVAGVVDALGLNR